MKLSDYIVEFFIKKGISHFFGYQGTMIAHLVDSIERNPNAHNHSCYNEQGAAFAACGYAQSTDSCACAYATSGPGAVNLLSGVANAYFDSQPVIFLTGQINTTEYTGINTLRQQAFQEIDIVSMAKPVTKYAVQITREQDIVRELNKAYYIANSGRKGPVLIDLPMNIQRGNIADPFYDMDDVCFTEYAQVNPEEAAVAAKSCADTMMDALASAKRPVIMLGNGVDKTASAEKLLAIARKLQIPVITSVLAKSRLAVDEPFNFGCIGSAYGHRYANMIANAKSDLLLCFGISLCTRQTGVKIHEFARNAKIIRMDIDSSNLLRDVHENGENEYKYHTDAALVIDLLSEAVAHTDLSFPVWMETCTLIKERLEAVDANIPERYVNTTIQHISEALEHAAAIAIDVGQHMVWSYHSFNNRNGQRLLFSGGHGAMGYALPAAIGAHYATGKPVACICGDGSFQMNIQELQWVIRENIPISIFVMNNDALGLICQQQRSLFKGLYAGANASGGFTSCSFAAIAQAYGIQAVTAAADISAADIGAFVRGAEPKLMEVRLPSDTSAYPKTSFGEPIHNQQPYIPKDIYNELMQL